jgi:glycosyltransferase involved in cell wall biosynthesis
MFLTPLQPSTNRKYQMTGLRVLIADFNLFAAVGGGQSVYRQIILQRPQDDFYYFTTSEKPDDPRPANAKPIPFRHFFTGHIGEVESSLGHFFHVFRDSIDMARSAYSNLGATTFDIVDTPDYYQNGLFLRTTLERHGIKVGKVALALHGTLSRALANGCAWEGDAASLFAQLHLRERMQFRAADVRYGISDYYAADQQARGHFPVAIVDPLLITRRGEPKMSAPTSDAADLVFIERRERIKGPDLFVDLAWWLPQGAYRNLVFVGGEGANHQGRWSSGILDEMSRRRRVVSKVVPHMSQDQLRGLCQAKSIVVVPSRFDTFSLVALEALLDGCPTVVSRTAGVARFIEERLPTLGWLLTDVGCDRSAAIPIEKILKDYDGRRAEIVETIERAALKPDAGTMMRMYDGEAVADDRAAGKLVDLADHFSMLSLTTDVVPHVRRYGPLTTNVIAALKPLTDSMLFRSSVRTAGSAHNRAGATVGRAYRGARDATTNVGARIAGSAFDAVTGYLAMDGGATNQLMEIRRKKSANRELIFKDERNSKARHEKLAYLAGLVRTLRLDRVRHFREMMRIERLVGNDAVAAAYGLRILRWLGKDQFNLLPSVCDSLVASGFAREAEAATVMYGATQNSEQAALTLLQEQFARQRVKPDLPFEMMDDRRGGKAFRTSIIVSLYNAASKLPTFMRILGQQTMVRSGECEIVLIDSGSPTNEYEIFKQAWPTDKLPVLYARSEKRETIQAAWNRGIKLATGEYLCFLGVDEAIHPECLDVLSDVLDKNPSVDWVMADALVTELNRKAQFDHDIMTYERRGYRQDWHYLDCTFLSYVGGLYRRSIHERFGYYDETFRAAGDTEFKNRVLPHIKSKYVPRMLGLYNNYLEERTTQHPRAEIEDLRAWYLHRTVGGVAYAFNQRPTEDVTDLMRDTLRYRKCFCQHWSTDLDYAMSLASYVSRRENSGVWRDAQEPIREQLQLYRRLELFPKRRSASGHQIEFAKAWRELRAAAPAHKERFGLAEEPAYQLLNDNRYEQHWWPWNG